MSDLTPAQKKAAMLIAGGATQRATAKSCSVSAQTMCGWMKLDAFRAELDGILAATEGDALRLLRSQKIHAVEALAASLDSKSPATKLAAAKAVLELTSKAPAPTATDARFTAIAAMLGATP